jgi:16S rRNA (adenine(1408)-N(1))-methyltransferase
MAESSLRSARPPAKGGLPNLLFAVAAVEQPPVELCGSADEVSTFFPWGSLLRGALATDATAASGIAALLKPAGRAVALVSIAERDAAATGLPTLTTDDGPELARRWAAFGLTLVDFRLATDDDITASGSTWAKRLRSAGSRPDRAIWRLVLRCGGSVDPTV